MLNNHFDAESFEKDWYALALEICKAIYHHPNIKSLKENYSKNGFLTLEEKSAFIDNCDMVKYQTIYEKYGPEGSEGYNKFSNYWKQWFQSKGVESLKHRGQRNSVDHIMFGSTPDPVAFLSKFEEEIGSQN